MSEETLPNRLTRRHDATVARLKNRRLSRVATIAFTLAIRALPGGPISRKQAKKRLRKEARRLYGAEFLRFHDPRLPSERVTVKALQDAAGQP